VRQRRAEPERLGIESPSLVCGVTKETMERLLPAVVSALYPGLTPWKVRLIPGTSVRARLTWRGPRLEFDAGEPDPVTATPILERYIRGCARGGARRALGGEARSSTAFSAAALVLTCAVAGARGVEDLIKDALDLNILESHDLGFRLWCVPLQRAVQCSDLKHLVPESDSAAELELDRCRPAELLSDPLALAHACGRLAALVEASEIGRIAGWNAMRTRCSPSGTTTPRNAMSTR